MLMFECVGLCQLHRRSEGGRIGVLSLNQEMVNAVPWHADSRWTQDWGQTYSMIAEGVGYMKFYFEKEQKTSCYLDRLTVSVISLSSRSWQLASFLLRISSTIWWSWGQARRSFSISTLPRNPVPPVISTVLSR